MKELVLTPELDKIRLPDWLVSINYTPMQQVEINNLINNHIWITANKIKIPVYKMSISHINSCIRCFNGRGKSFIPSNYLGGRNKWLKIFNKELSSRV